MAQAPVLALVLALGPALGQAAMALAQLGQVAQELGQVVQQELASSSHLVVAQVEPPLRR